ncbi:hypothetical protein H9N28_02720 [Rhodobacter capsulatus]|uniref:Uncharacterized protein n=1 Tax=Rhodobacter capsulatus TaxID=1061 RepID=A0A0Q0UIK4_RHOCA|nr:hypothetical protein [Rhodobacter capsulatus]KQB13265.1 hypothetical protein AP073_03670 [Rhodobacter capsulatus]KQB13525.1 hypothetical protein AP071_03920 [Rhodobacter capsulatus]PZX24247.1 hypothetical protein LY44_01981 [Rhodobacter capsulatus]QNR63775.1 hypothetical protein H9N28_02720 [Rhodobacter capsulatus]WER09927.1 hypothetical protein PUH89_02770 [Rhodobacter capsulatus]
MIGFGRLLVLLAVMAISGYWVLRLSMASRKREALEAAWNEGAGDALDFDAYLKSGMAAWENSLPQRMLRLVMLLPFAIVGSLVFFAN